MHSDVILYRENQEREAEAYNRKHAPLPSMQACPRCDSLIDSSGLCTNGHQIDKHNPPGSPARIARDKALARERSK